MHIGCCLNPVEGSFVLFRFVLWLDCLLLKEGASAFCSRGDCLKCFLLLRSLRVFAKVAGFHLNDCIEYFTAPCWPPLEPRKNINYDLFSPLDIFCIGGSKFVFHLDGEINRDG